LENCQSSGVLKKGNPERRGWLKILNEKRRRKVNLNTGEAVTVATKKLLARNVRCLRGGAGKGRGFYAGEGEGDLAPHGRGCGCWYTQKKRDMKGRKGPKIAKPWRGPITSTLRF